MPVWQNAPEEGDHSVAPHDGRRGLLRNRRIILASNRGPVDYQQGAQGLTAKRGAGGVVSALAALCNHTRVTWISAAMTEADRLAAAQHDRKRPSFLPSTLDHRFVVVDEGIFQRHYSEFSNPILWFVQHYLWNAAYGPRIDAAARTAWSDGYLPVNRAFASTLAPLARASAGERPPFVLLHDYQLYLTPHFLRQRVPEAVLSFFVHIPWPASGYWQLLPRDMRQPIIESLCQVDVLGFQTRRFVRNFLTSCEDFLEDAEVDYLNSTVRWRGRISHIRTYPISVDVEQLREVATSAVCARYVEKLRPHLGQQTIVRVDRLEPSKNIYRGFEAFRALLTRRPDLIGRVKFLAFLIPSRSAIPEYQRYRERVFGLIAAINAQFGTPGWAPIEVFYENDFIQAIAAMRLADVVLVNPVIDGMNLVAKEAVVVNERHGVLVLSESAGAHDQLGESALSIAPGDVEGTATAIEAALTMSLPERYARLRALRSAVESQDLSWWVDTQLADLDALTPRGATSPFAIA